MILNQYSIKLRRLPEPVIIGAVILFHCFTTTAQTDYSWHAKPETVEKLSKEGPEFNYTEGKVPAYSLPDVLKTDDGRKVVSADLWNSVRRPELMELFRKNVFGRFPETAYKEVFKIVNLDKNALNGEATHKQVEITINSAGKSLIIRMSLFTPNKASKPVPAFLLIDNWVDEKNEPSWKSDREFCPVNEIIARGYAVAAYSATDADPDNFDDFKNGIHGLLDKDPRPDDAWGTIAAWGWGASRCMDFLVTDNAVAKDKVTLVGFSRGGKTALWAGAEDTRFAMVVSNESGCGGAALARRRFGETVERINTVFPHWFCSNYKIFNNNEDSLPVDMHELLSLIAPRALYIACADEDLWGDPKGSYLALQDAVPVFNLFGVKSDIPEKIPGLDKQITSGMVAFHIREGAHNLLIKDWEWFMDFSDTVLK